MKWEIFPFNQNQRKWVTVLLTNISRVGELFWNYLCMFEVFENFTSFPYRNFLKISSWDFPFTGTVSRNWMVFMLRRRTFLIIKKIPPDFSATFSKFSLDFKMNRKSTKDLQKLYFCRFLMRSYGKSCKTECCAVLFWPVARGYWLLSFS
jgi:hypothetical protein